LELAIVLAHESALPVLRIDPGAPSTQGLGAHVGSRNRGAGLSPTLSTDPPPDGDVLRLEREEKPGVLPDTAHHSVLHPAGAWRREDRHARPGFHPRRRAGVAWLSPRLPPRHLAASALRDHRRHVGVLALHQSLCRWPSQERRT